MVESGSHLIKHICDISNHAKICAHHNTFDSKPFIDWYILFQIEDNVGVDVIRKKYHKYALLLHPDKNNHPKAEFAFKLVSEAYACLSDDARRLEFDVKRLNNIQTTPLTRTKVKGSSSSDRSRSKKISARLKEVKARFMEEAKVIEKCLKANANVDAFDKEMPVFDPNAYATQGHPRFRVWRCKESKSSSKCLKKLFEFDNQVKCDSPVFESKPNKPPIKLKSIPMSI
ncbi:chaperone DnaJ-domain superfamily protein [Artemisia annua]|uniref:Chaperone DnaJ-domain superfamily protein n=1 Tax=Artemisia annua TaxID=35608 RepID=A0A2U1NN86_ARTAN|nr:chaperone DnaJ-domain superfamily protein [Artemisia annua]